MLSVAPAYFIYLCPNDAKTNDDKILIRPNDPENMATTDFEIIYKAAGEQTHRFTCKREFLIPYVRTTLVAAALDSSVTRYRFIQIMPPAAPSTMISVPMPDKVADLNPFLEVVNAQLQILCMSAAWPKAQPMYSLRCAAEDSDSIN
jgi:hypothetical protein